jgi:hypothetical protein
MAGRLSTKNEIINENWMYTIIANADGMISCFVEGNVHCWHIICTKDWAGRFPWRRRVSFAAECRPVHIVSRPIPPCDHLRISGLILMSHRHSNNHKLLPHSFRNPACDSWRSRLKWFERRDFRWDILILHIVSIFANQSNRIKLIGQFQYLMFAPRLVRDWEDCVYWIQI